MDYTCEYCQKTYPTKQQLAVHKQWHNPIWKQKIIKSIRKNNTGKKNGMWKGDKVQYKSLHDWVTRHKPKPEFCECCNTNKPNDVANISQKYKRDINDFEWLCRSCHMHKDKRILNLKQYQDGKM